MGTNLDPQFPPPIQSASAASDPAETAEDKEAGYRIFSALPPVDLWRIILNYTDPSRDIAKAIYPGLENVFELMTIVAIRDSIKGSEEFITALANHLDTKIYPEQIKGLKEIAERCKILENPEKSEITPDLMLATVSAQTQRLKRDLIAILQTLSNRDLARLRATSHSIFKDLKLPPFLQNILHIADIKQNWDQILKVRDRTLEQQAKSLIQELLNISEPEIAMEWLENLSNNQLRSKLSELILSHYLSKGEAEAAEDFIRNSGKLFRSYGKVQYYGKIMDHFLEESEPNPRMLPKVWMLLMRRSAPAPTATEAADANKDLETIQTMLKEGQIRQAFELAKNRLTDIDPATKALKFPTQCSEFLQSVLALPKNPWTEPSTKMSEGSTSAASLPAENEDDEAEKIMLQILEFIITDLPDDDRKRDLIQQAKTAPFFSSIPGGSIISGLILKTAETEFNKRPRRLYKLAEFFIKGANFKLAFEVANQIQLPPAILGFVINVLDSGKKLTDEESKALLTKIQNLPDEFKYLLIQRNLKKPHLLLAQLEKEFNLSSYKQEAEKQACIVVTSNKIMSYVVDLLREKGNEGLTEAEKRQFYLLASRMSTNEIDELRTKFLLKEAVYKDLKEHLDMYFHALTFEFDDEIQHFFQELPILFQNELIKSVKEGNPALSAALEKQLNENDKKQLATIDDEYRSLSIVSANNPMSESVYKELQGSELLVNGYTYALISRKFSSDDIYKYGVNLLWDHSVSTWRERGYETDFRSNRFKTDK